MLPLLLVVKTAVAVLMSLATFFGGVDTYAIARFLFSPSERFLVFPALYTRASDGPMKPFIPAAMSNVSAHLLQVLPTPSTHAVQFVGDYPLAQTLQDPPASGSSSSLGEDVVSLPFVLPGLNPSPLNSNALWLTTPSTKTPITIVEADEISNGSKLGYLAAVKKPSTLSTPSFSTTFDVTPPINSPLLQPSIGHEDADSDKELIVYVKVLPQIREWNPVVVEFIENVLCFVVRGIIINLLVSILSLKKLYRKFIEPRLPRCFVFQGGGSVDKDVEVNDDVHIARLVADIDETVRVTLDVSAPAGVVDETSPAPPLIRRPDPSLGVTCLEPRAIETKDNILYEERDGGIVDSRETTNHVDLRIGELEFAIALLTPLPSDCDIGLVEDTPPRVSSILLDALAQAWKKCLTAVNTIGARIPIILTSSNFSAYSTTPKAYQDTPEGEDHGNCEETVNRDAAVLCDHITPALARRFTLGGDPRLTDTGVNRISKDEAWGLQNNSASSFVISVAAQPQATPISATIPPLPKTPSLPARAPPICSVTAGHIPRFEKTPASQTCLSKDANLFWPQASSPNTLPPPSLSVPLSATAPVFRPVDKRKDTLKEANALCLARRKALAMASSSVATVLASVEEAAAAPLKGGPVSARNQGKSNGAKKRRKIREAAAAVAALVEAGDGEGCPS